MPKVIRTPPSGGDAVEFIKNYLPEGYEVRIRDDFAFAGYQVSSKNAPVLPTLYIEPNLRAFKVVKCFDSKLPGWIMKLANAIEDLTFQEVTIVWDG